MRKLKLGKWIATLMILALLVFFASFMAAKNLERHATEFLADVEKLKVNQTTVEELRVFSEKYSRYSGGNLIAMEHAPYLFTFDNTWFFPIHWGNPTSFGAGMQIADGRLTSINIGEEIGITTRRGANLDEEIWRAEKGCPEKGFCSGARIDGYGIPIDYSGTLSTLRATVEDRKRAYSFNLDCLSKLGGCTAGELKPKGWK